MKTPLTRMCMEGYTAIPLCVCVVAAQMSARALTCHFAREYLVG